MVFIVKELNKNQLDDLRKTAFDIGKLILGTVLVRSFLSSLPFDMRIFLIGSAIALMAFILGLYIGGKNE